MTCRVSEFCWRIALEPTNIDDDRYLCLLLCHASTFIRRGLNGPSRAKPLKNAKEKTFKILMIKQRSHIFHIQCTQKKKRKKGKRKCRRQIGTDGSECGVQRFRTQSRDARKTRIISRVQRSKEEEASEDLIGNVTRIKYNSSDEGQS